MKFFKLALAMACLGVSTWSFADPVLYTETADKVRFEQYTVGVLKLYRLPSPGSSTFPGGTCTSLTTPGGTEIANRFIAFYLFVKSNNRTYFVQYETSTCQVLSFGMDG